MKLNFSVIDKINDFLLKGLIFILPLFFLPFLSAAGGMDNFGKQLLLWLVLPFMLFLRVTKAIKRGEFRLARSPFYAAIAVYLAAAALAVFTSADRFSSFFGALNNFSLPYLGLAAGALVYFFVVNSIEKKEAVSGIIKTLLASYVLVVIVFFLLLFFSWLGFLESASPLFFYFRLALGFLDDLAVYVAVMDVLIFAFLWRRGPGGLLWFGKNRSSFFKILSIFSLWILVEANSVPAWWCLAVGVIFVVALRYWLLGKQTGDSGRLDRLWTMTIIMIPVLFLFLNYLVLPGDRNPAALWRLDLKNTYSVALSAVKSRPFFGYGPEMFSSAISLFRDQSLNNGPVWDTRYRGGESHIFVLAASTGLIGILSYAVLIFLWCYHAGGELRNVKNIFKKNSSNLSADDLNIFLAISAVIIALLVGQFAYAANTVLFFLFWVFLALGTAASRLFLPASFQKETPEQKGDIRINIKSGSATFIVFAGLAFLLFSGWAILGGKYIKYYLADINFRLAGSGAAAEKERRLLSADNFNPHNYNYKIGLAKYYLALALDEISGGGNAAVIRDNFNKSIDWAKKAQAASPRNVAIYETIGAIYRHIGVYSPEGYSEAIKAFKEASVLEPTNPVIVSELGNIYLAQGDYDSAIRSFERAAELKSDFFPAEFGLAKAYEGRGEYDRALSALGKLETAADNLDVYFAEGRIYYNRGNLDEAIKKFRQVIALEPLHANGLYSLALALEKSGAFDDARFYYGMVLKLNPGNTEIEKKIEELKKF